MVISRILKKSSKFSEIIVQLNHYIVSTSDVHKNLTQIRKIPAASLKFRCFSGDSIGNGTKLSISESSQSPTATRMSRFVQSEARDVLFEYLHCTRSVGFTDAEHISKNSPIFLRKLLSKIDSEKDVAPSFSKFLRYHPINEFEPFFESLGLSPSEISVLLPRHLMFLSDDSLMLENFQVLCNFGIPRAKIGRMYKEAKEIFSYDFGVLASTLVAYAHLGLSRSTILKLVISSPVLLVGGIDSEFVRVLEKLKAVGKTSDWIGGYLSDRRTYDWRRMRETIDFLEKVGYNDERFSDLLRTSPELVFEGSGKKVYVLFGRMAKLGLKMNEVYSLFMKHPQVLSLKSVKNLLLAVDFLFGIGMEMENIASMVSNHIELMGSSTLNGPRSVYQRLKIRKDGLRQIIRDEPLKLFSLGSRTKLKTRESRLSPDSIRKKTEFLLRLGYVENSDEMVKALKKFRGRGDQLEERFNCLIEAGIDCHIAVNLIKHAPNVLNQSKDVIKKKIHCLTNCLGYPLESIVAFPAYLCYEMERINQRMSMYAWVRDKGAAKPTLSLSTILTCSDERFIKYFVNVHEEGPAMWRSLMKTSDSS